MPFQLPPEYVNTPMGIIYDPRINDGAAITFVQIFGLYWDPKNPPHITLEDLMELTGRSRSSLYGHMSTLRNSGWLLFSTADDGTLMFSFPDFQSKNLDCISLINSLLKKDSRRGGRKRESAVQNSGRPSMPRDLLIAFVDALADVTQIDKTLNYGRMAKEAKDLWIAGYTHEQIREVYSKGGKWYREHWAGKKGEPPGLGIIRSTIKGLLNGSHAQPDEPAGFQAIREYRRQQGLSDD